MTICVPVMSLARSEQRYITTFATSHGADHALAFIDDVVEGFAVKAQ
jgi:hypothetical protein